jgi:anthranilate phosphoribosyltransferase
MIKEAIEKVSASQNLTVDEAYSVMHTIMNGGANEPQIAGLLLALKTKGETSEEIAGFIKAMRVMSIKIKSEDSNTIDLCGTGGDESNTFNISTAASFVVAGAGVKVAKHGNGSISSKSGSADVLTEMGVNINLSPALAGESLNEIGITFLFAPNYHPAMKYAAPVRKALGTKTVFNILGPLTNPAGVKKQMIGVFNTDTAKKMADAVKELEMEKVCFVCTSNKYDEISLTGETKVFEFDNSKGLSQYSLNSNDFNSTSIDIKDIQSDSVVNNSKIILSVIRDKHRNEAFEVITANSALALRVAGWADDLLVCKSAAEESILSGRAYNKFLALKKFGEKYS